MDARRDTLLRQARFLVSRLERLSADSVWAHKASGIRGALLRIVESSGEGPIEIARLNSLLDEGFACLYKAAQEIPNDFEQ